MVSLGPIRPPPSPFFSPFSSFDLPMVGTPQLPLKYRRKGVSDYWVLSPYRDMQIHSTSGFDPYKYGSDGSVPHSPTFCSSSSSVAPSSPVRSLYTPEPSYSPAPEPYIASSPKSPRPGRKGFWEVAFNYGPEFPYKGRPCAQSPDYGREQFRTRRRSSSASAPTLISDVEPSEYSDFNDPFHIDDDATDEDEGASNVTIVNSKDELALSGSRDSDLPQDAVSTASPSKSWMGEMDVAAVLLELSRQTRSASVESRAEVIAISNMTSLNSAREELVDPVSDETPWTNQDLVNNSPVQSKNSAHSIPHTVEQEKNLSNLRECGTHGQEPFLEEASIFPQASNPSAEVHRRSYVAGDPTVERSAFQQARLNLNAASEDTEMDGVGIDVPGSHGHDIKPTCPTIANEQGVIYVHQSIFSGALTPLSSPALTSSDLSDLSEPLSGLSSPRNNASELTGPSDNTQQGRESRCLNAYSSVPGPSTHQIGSADQHVAVTKDETTQLPRQSCMERPATDLDASAGAQQSAQKTKKKRARSNSATESSSLRPSPSILGPDVPRPRKKRSKKTEGNRSTPQAGDTCTQSCSSSSLASTSACTLSGHDDSSACAVDSVTVPSPAISDDCDVDVREELCGCLIQAMALSRASSMPASSLLREVLQENPHLADQRTRSDWLRLVSSVLESHEVFGRVDRKGFDADDKPLEPQWFYVPERDPDHERASLLREMMPKKRTETKKHKQYFFKPLGKISRWDPEDAP